LGEKLARFFPITKVCFHDLLDLRCC
jgi:hypothetical protein